MSFLRKQASRVLGVCYLFLLRKDFSRRKLLASSLVGEAKQPPLPRWERVRGLESHFRGNDTLGYRVGREARCFIRLTCSRRYSQQSR